MCRSRVGWARRLVRNICMPPSTSKLCYVRIDPVSWLHLLSPHTVSWRCWRATIRPWWCNPHLFLQGLQEWHNASVQGRLHKRPLMVCVKEQLPLLLLSSNLLISIDLTLFIVVTFRILEKTYIRTVRGYFTCRQVRCHGSKNTRLSSFCRLPSSTTADV